MGSDVSHHHSHVYSQASADNSNSATGHDAHHHGVIAFNATEPVPSVNDSSSNSNLLAYSAVSATEAEHEHANHSHTPSHPPAEPLFIASFFQIAILSDDEITYTNRRYAPPIPPPYS